jgi:hypothetical protein
MERTVDAAIAAVAAGQSSVFSRAQAYACGASRALCDRRVRAGRWEVLHPGVYGLPGVPGSYLRSLWASHLAVGPHSVVSHESAAALHHFEGFPRRRIVLNVHHGAHPRLAGGFVHQITDMAPTHVTRDVVRGLPVSTPERTLVDLARYLSTQRLDGLLDDLVVARRTSLAAVGAVVGEVLRPGKRGLPRLATVLDRRGPGYVPPGSVLEKALHEVVDVAGLPPLARQHPLPGPGAIEGLVDGCWPDARLIVEADGRRWHSRIRDAARDAARDAEAARAGYQTLRLFHEHIVGDAEGTAATLRDVRAVRLAQLDPGELAWGR